MVSSVLLLRQNLRDFSITQEICLLFMLLKCGVWSVLDKRAVPIARIRIERLSHLWETARAEKQPRRVI